MVFITLQASVFRSAAHWMEKWPQDKLSAQCLNVVMQVPNDLPRTIQDYEKWKMCFTYLGEKG